MIKFLRGQCFRFGAYMAMCFIFSTCMAAFAGSSLNDPHPWGIKIFFLQAGTAVYILISSLPFVYQWQYYPNLSIVLCANLFVHVVAYFTLYFLDENGIPIHKADAGRDFLGNLFGLIFLSVILVSSRFCLRQDQSLISEASLIEGES